MNGDALHSKILECWQTYVHPEPSCGLLNFAPSLSSEFRTRLQLILSRELRRKTWSAWRLERVPAEQSPWAGWSLLICAHPESWQRQKAPGRCLGPPGIRSPQTQHRVTQRNHRIPPTVWMLDICPAPPGPRPAVSLRTAPTMGYLVTARWLTCLSSMPASSSAVSALMQFTVKSSMSGEGAIHCPPAQRLTRH